MNTQIKQREALLSSLEQRRSDFFSQTKNSDAIYLASASAIGALAGVSIAVAPLSSIAIPLIAFGAVASALLGGNENTNSETNESDIAEIKAKALSAIIKNDYENFLLLDIKKNLPLQDILELQLYSSYSKNKNINTHISKLIPKEEILPLFPQTNNEQRNSLDIKI